MLPFIYKYKKFIIDYFNSKLSLAAYKISSLLVIVILTRLLSLRDFGLYTIFVSLSGILASIALLGIPNSIVRFFSDDIEKPLKSQILKFLLILYLFTYVALSILLILLKDNISMYFFKSENYEELVTYVILNGLFIGLYQINTYILQSRKNFDIIRNIDIIIGSLKVPIVGVLAYFFELKGAIVGSILSFALYWIYSSLKIFDTLYEAIKSPIYLRYHKNILKYTIEVSINSISMYSYTWLDTLIVSFFLTPEEVALYKVSITLISTISMLIGYGNVLAPRMVKWGVDYIKSKLLYIVGVHIVLVLPFIILLNSMPNVVLSILYGDKYVTASNLVKILSINLILAIYAYLGQIFVLKDRPILSVILYLFLSISNLLLNITLILKYGVIGAVYASVLAYFTALIVSIVLFYKFVKSTKV